MSNVWTVNQVFNEAGCYDITYTQTQNGCTINKTIVDAICVSAKPIADFDVTQTDPFTGIVNYHFENLSENATKFNWNFGSIDSTTIKHPVKTFPEVNAILNVCLTASTTDGCSTITCKPIEIKEPLIYYVPNTFSPDGNEFNQYFKPVFTSGYDPNDFVMFVFNRWGEIIFESKDPAIGWDGAYNFQPAPVGTYSYKIEFKTLASDERKFITGHVNLLR